MTGDANHYQVEYTSGLADPVVATIDTLKLIGFWIEHNCRKTKKDYLVKHETVEQLNEGRMPTL